MMYNNIKLLRKKARLTQKLAAEYLGCSQQAYSSYELGIRDIPLEVLLRLAELHNTTTDYLLGRTEYRDVPDCFLPDAKPPAD